VSTPLRSTSPFSERSAPSPAPPPRSVAAPAAALVFCCFFFVKLYTLLDFCVSSLRRGHANLLCTVPSLTDDPRRESSCGGARYPPLVLFVLRAADECSYLRAQCTISLPTPQNVCRGAPANTHCNCRSIIKHTAYITIDAVALHHHKHYSTLACNDLRLQREAWRGALCQG